jgi:tetraacyldisaccharide 4'-kinase
MSPSDFHDLISGQRRGPAASALRLVLGLAEPAYAITVRWRNWLYDHRLTEIRRVGIPVVSVGNLTLGGTGKTPAVEWIARWLREHDVRVTLVSRGYGAEAGILNDEALELEQRLPDVPHVQNPDRVEAAQMAIEEFACQAIVLDDAFQHRRIARDLDIVLLDALEPFGFNHVFPRGTLREPLGGLRRAHMVVLSRADLIQPAERETIRRRVRRYAPQSAWAETIHAPRGLRDAVGRQEPLAMLAGKRVAAFCGVGNPAGFRHTLKICGLETTAFREFADHYRFARKDVESLSAWADASDAEAVVCTHKDLVKLGTDRIGRLPLWAVAIGLEFLTGEKELQSRLAELLLQIRAEGPRSEGRVRDSML